MNIKLNKEFQYAFKVYKRDSYTKNEWIPINDFEFIFTISEYREFLNKLYTYYDNFDKNCNIPLEYDTLVRTHFITTKLKISAELEYLYDYEN
jgi:hypothetical protein